MLGTEWSRLEGQSSDEGVCKADVMRRVGHTAKYLDAQELQMNLAPLRRDAEQCGFVWQVYFREYCNDPALGVSIFEILR